MSDKLNEIAEGLRLTACTQDDIRAALEEAAADERKAIREIVNRHACRRYRCYHNILAALDAREAKPGA